MKRTFYKARPFACAVLVALVMSGCGGGGSSGASATPPPATGTPSPVPPPNTPPQNTSIPSATRALIVERYSASPTMAAAATGFAGAAVDQWNSASATSTYNEKLAVTAAHAEICMLQRAIRLGAPVTSADLARFLGTLASTPELFAAMRKSNKLQDGNPLSLSTTETSACAQAGGL